jgi:hypothetical protein
MKRLLFIAMVITGMVSACSKTRPNRVEDLLTGSGWRITNMIGDNENISYFFAPYTMKFDEEGSVVVSDGEHLFNGTWSVFKENIDEEGGKETVLKLEFSNESSFSELNYSWEITSLTETRIDAQHLNYKGGTDQLTMIKK